MAEGILAGTVAMLFVFSIYLAAGDPQTNILNLGCSQYNATNPVTFLSDLNTTIAALGSQVSSSFPLNLTATASVPRAADPVYALTLCRGYLSVADCLACVANASSTLRAKCGAANGARVIYDGCELRYESTSFFDQGTEPGNVGLCSNNTLDTASSFSLNAGDLLQDLSEAVPRVPNLYAAAASGGAAYGVAQCAGTIDEETCAACLTVAYGNIKGCPPAANGRAVDAGCFIRYSDTAFFPANDTLDLAPFLKSGGSSANKGAIIGGVLGGAAFLLLFALLVYFWARRYREPGKGGRGGILGATELQGPMRFHYRDLKSATKNFSEENKLGEGGFGDVYKGVLRNGTTIAIKKIIVGEANRAKATFQSEVTLISNVHHRNLIRLLGCSAKGPDLLLVYEYMANNSLDKHLFGEGRGSLNWKRRLDIIVGVARGLAYLHQEYHVCIIHRDIKSSNILLNEDFQAKIADFGLARLFPSDQTHLTTKFAGTLGYTAPEYAIHGQLSEKVDTYSYGVVVLEIISGRKSNDVSLEPMTQYLLEWAWKLYEEGSTLDLVDETLSRSEFNPEDMKRIIEIALLCTQSAVAARPAMSEVVVMLLSQGNSLLPPTRPVFIDAARRVSGEDTSTTNSSNPISNATASISQFSAR